MFYSVTFLFLQIHLVRNTIRCFFLYTKQRIMSLMYTLGSGDDMAGSKSLLDQETKLLVSADPYPQGLPHSRPTVKNCFETQTQD